MSSAISSVSRQPLPFQGSAAPVTATPTLADVMTKLSQVQQNQTKIFDAVRAVQNNQLSLAVMVQDMFEVTQLAAPAVMTQIRAIGSASISNMLRNANNP
jgi:hypothetical protein